MTKPVVIIGAGPAGLSCARRLVAAGIPVVVLDDNPLPGGQYFRQLPPRYHASPRSQLLRETARAQPLFATLRDPLVTYLPATTAWCVPEPLTIAYSGPNASGRIAASAIVIATGAQDAPFPFPGWTLPGVISAGGCLNLAKGQGLVPEGKVVVVGNGPLVLVAAATVAAAGAHVTHVIEAQPTARVAAAMARGVFLAPGLVSKGLGYRARLLKAGAKFLSGHMIARAIGTEMLEGVEISPVGSDGRPDMMKTSFLEADSVVSGYGLLPGSEFARLLGCRMVRSPVLGGWVPERSPQLETSIPQIYAIGDGAGIGGVEIAMTEGVLAAEAIIGDSVGTSKTAERYRRLDQFRHRLSSAYNPGVKLTAAEADTIICRCEELRLADLVAECDAGDRHLHRLKSSTRLGMGRCQGRNCLSSAAVLLNVDREDFPIPYPRVRPPVRPVRIRDVIADKSIGPAREPDEINAFANEETCP